MNLRQFAELITDLECNVDRVQLYYLDHPKVMDEVCTLAKSGENDNLKMQITALVYSARMLSYDRAKPVSWRCKLILYAE